MGARQLARLTWLTAGRPLASAALDMIAPAQWHQRRRRRLLSERPAWVAPDPAIRQAMEARIDRFIDPARPVGGFYKREIGTALHHPGVTQDMEETQEFGRRFGLRQMHPFWDVDLIEMLYRVPPSLLMADGRSKSLLRGRIAQRLPGLGLKRRGKISAAHVFQGAMAREAPAALETLGGFKVLDAMGAVAGSSAGSANAGQLWALMNLETWLRRRL
jgi:hypothetical protein